MLHNLGHGECRFAGVGKNGVVSGCLKNIPDQDGDQGLVLNDKDGRLRRFDCFSIEV
ncbi:hypothetical protein SAMN04487779_103522 [Belnapia rosea]|uniref:Uncharacterized protein n=1 Tax=Belnapia rosea TaxID=938405 RepID=A0A1G7CV67_9PROT|nr:hypothetical protein SAMN04487779_103522 [Belnapia rosea]